MAFIITGGIRVSFINDRFLDGNYDVIVLLVHVHRGIAFGRLFYQSIDVSTLILFGRSRHRHLGSTGADKDTHGFCNTGILGGVRVGQGYYVVTFLEVRDQGIRHGLAIGSPLEKHGVLVGVESSHRVRPILGAATRLGIGHHNVRGFLDVGNIDLDGGRILMTILVIDAHHQAIRSLGLVIEHGIGLYFARLRVDGEQVLVAADSLVGILAVLRLLVRVEQLKRSHRGALGLVFGHSHGGIVDLRTFIDIPNGNVDHGFIPESAGILDNDLYLEHCVGKGFKVNVPSHSDYTSRRVDGKRLTIITASKAVSELAILGVRTGDSSDLSAHRRMLVNNLIGESRDGGLLVAVRNLNRHALRHAEDVRSGTRRTQVADLNRQSVRTLGFKVKSILRDADFTIVIVSQTRRSDLENIVIITTDNLVGQLQLIFNIRRLYPSHVSVHRRILFY